MSLLDRFRLWRVRRQIDRCAAGRHHWKYELDRVYCSGCGKRYGG